MKFRVRKSALKVILLLLLVVLCALGVFWLLQRWEQRDTVEMPGEPAQETGENPGMVYYDGGWYAPRENMETILLMGLDEYAKETSGEGYSNFQQADFLLLILLDHAAKTASAIHLNRDTMTDIQILGVTGAPAGSFTGQLALAHTYGDGGRVSCENTVEAVSNLLYGVSIDHYLSLTMDAIPILNDLVGGVEVTVLDDFSEVDSSMVQGETVLLQGQQALTYVRTRRGLEDSSNLHRMERQRQYMLGLMEQLQRASAEDPDFMIDAVLSVNDYFVSDYTVEQLSALGGNAESYRFDEIYTLEGEAVQGEQYMEFYVDETALQCLVMELFYVPNTEES